MLLLLGACGPTEKATVRLRTLVAGEQAPARLELTDATGQQIVPDDALTVAGDCGWLPVHNWVSWWAAVQLARARDARVRDVTTGTDQFYSPGRLETSLAPGEYRLRAFKGLEYEVADTRFTVGAGEEVDVDLPLRRWIDMPAAGWLGADDHLHIPRPYRSFDLTILRWMAAEDLHVANLLQMGLAQDLHLTPQRVFGPRSVSSRGLRFVASGQENPRTHVAGHAIILGAHEYIDFPESYLAYERFFRSAADQGGIAGFAHWGLGGADEGLAVWAPRRLVDFVEVLGFGVPYYDSWYDLLDIGLRIAPTAGTDYPCSPYLPGRQRFYTRVEGEPTYESWLDGVERARTFVTNGPMLELEVAGSSIGGEVHLDGPSEVTVLGRVRFDPRRDDVRRLELVQAGAVVHRAGPPKRPGRLDLEVSLPLSGSTWLALRSAGSKIGETPLGGMQALREALFHLPRPAADDPFSGEGSILEDGSVRPSAAHTAPIWVFVEGTPTLAEQPTARAAAQRWLDLLARLESRFAPAAMAAMAGFPGRGDGLGAEDLERARGPLLDSIEATRAELAGIIEPSED
ncbi:MAG: CehA/McbA family metallohydrolase [Thermoanaerobaculia bacterium]|nr:CehA/McbA family metallohydrolase [Thermoanaerobaculia bacterium]